MIGIVDTRTLQCNMTFLYIWYPLNVVFVVLVFVAVRWFYFVVVVLVFIAVMWFLLLLLCWSLLL